MAKSTSTNQINKAQLTEKCGMSVTLNMIGGRWKLNILGLLVSETTLSYGELKRRLPGISEKMLYQQLTELIRDGLIHKQIDSEMPLRTRYYLTDLGESLEEVLLGMYKWGSALAERKTEKTEA